MQQHIHFQLGVMIINVYKHTVFTSEAFAIYSTSIYKLCSQDNNILAAMSEPEFLKFCATRTTC